MCATGNLLLVAVLFAAPPSLDDVPAVERTKPDFYNAVATKRVEVAWSAEPAAVPRDGEITLTLTVRNTANPHELAKPNLADVDAVTKHFQVLDRTDPPPDRTATEVRFTYTLRPRKVGEATVPALRYAYYRFDQKEMQAARTKALPVTVTPPAPKVSPSTPPVPLDAPEEFFTLAEDTHRFRIPGRFGWLLPAAVVPFAVVGWVLVWRWVFPDAARLAKLRRNRAVRLALDRLKKARTSPDPAGEAAAAFRGYLLGRFGVPPSAQTPTEVDAALTELGEPADRAADAAAFLRGCDATRFADVDDNGASLAAQAEALILAWEGADA